MKCRLLEVYNAIPVVHKEASLLYCLLKYSLYYRNWCVVVWLQVMLKASGGGAAVYQSLEPFSSSTDNGNDGVGGIK